MAADALNAQLAARPTAEELAERGIMRGEPGGLSGRVQAAASELQKAMAADALNAHLAARPTQDELQDKGILKGTGLSSKVLGAAEDLQRSTLIECRLEPWRITRELTRA